MFPGERHLSSCYHPEVVHASLPGWSILNTLSGWLWKKPSDHGRITRGFKKSDTEKGELFHVCRHC
jgi:hypothetical protein